MSITDFFLKYNKKFLDYDGIYGPQCVDVTKAYFVEVLGLPSFKGDAIDYWKDIPGFTRFENKGLQWPKPGDIVIWDTPPYGHIAIVNWSRTFDLGVFEQNYPVGSPCHYRETTYNGIIGWLRPNKTIRVAFVGMSQADADRQISHIKRYSPKDYQAVVYNKSIAIPGGNLVNEQCWSLIEELDIKEKYIFLSYYSPSASHEVASYYPKRNCSFAAIPQGATDTIFTHAFLHLARKYINANKLGYIEDVEYYPTQWSNAGDFNEPGWRFAEQYNKVNKYL